MPVFSIRGYLRERLGISRFPRNQSEWLDIPEYALCNFTSGQIFYDPMQELTSVQKQFASYYPSDIWKVHLARAAYACWFFGEFNYPWRLAPRGDAVTGSVAIGEFCSAVMRLVFLINRQYAPYWKWMHWGFKRLPKYAAEIDPLLDLLVASSDMREQADYIMGICRVLRRSSRRKAGGRGRGHGVHGSVRHHAHARRPRAGQAALALDADTGPAGGLCRPDPSEVSPAI